MPLPSPNLDDRRFEDLVEAAKSRVAATCPEWTDLSAHDPGVVLLEVFAYMTELMIYRLNRVPQKLYVEFLNLMGVTPHPPVAASVELVFSLRQALDRRVEIPRGTRVTLGSGSGSGTPPVFATVNPVVLKPGQTSVRVLASHAELVEGELAGVATGRSGLVMKASKSPLIAGTGDELDLAVRVEVSRDGASAVATARGSDIEFEGKIYRTWREVEDFVDVPKDDRLVYLADRTAGRIMFAPSFRGEGVDGSLRLGEESPGAVPEAGREVRLWYRVGGGAAGNVPAGSLTTIKDPIPGLTLTVTNPEAATGGQDAETVENALVRGPQEIHSLRRAVTARDFELLARRLNPGAVARAKAITPAALWKHAEPGTVEVLLVPQVPARAEGDRVTVSMLQAQETELARERTQEILDARRPLGTACRVHWVRYKTVRVKADVVIRRDEDPAAVRRRVLERLYQRINPLPAGPYPGWAFGESLRASHVFDIALAEPGVNYVSDVRFIVDEVPQRKVLALAADAFQPRTWYAASGNILFRSLNDGAGWEAAGRFAGDAGDETVQLIEVSSERPGLIAVATTPASGGGWRLYFSNDCGETWPKTPNWKTDEKIEDMAWMVRDGQPIVIWATAKGVRTIAPGGEPNLMPVTDGGPTSFCAVATARDERDRLNVAVAVPGKGGVYLSRQGGAPGSFALTGLKDEDVRGLFVQPGGTLWAALASYGDDPGKGAFTWDLNTLEDPASGWVPHRKGWKGGYCRSIAFDRNRAYAATWNAGVLRLDLNAADPAWKELPFQSGLPEREGGVLKEVRIVAVTQTGSNDQAQSRPVMAAGEDGVFRSLNAGEAYSRSAGNEFETVTLPGTWLFCSAEHDINVKSEDEGR
jgi:hypothetical protein